MKKLTILIVCIFGFIFAIENVWAQTCSTDFTVDTSITASTCASNGEIEVTLGGDLSNFSYFEYGLTSTTGSFTILPQSSTNILQNIPPGNYNLSVRGVCSIGNSYDVVKEVKNVEVGGNYQSPTVSFNNTASRNAYYDSATGCSTGKIALNVNNGYGGYTFNILSAPAGVTLGVIPTSSISVIGSVYTLPGTYPPGDYKIQVLDNCSSGVTADISLNHLTTLPNFNTESSSAFSPNVDALQGPCSVIGFNTTLNKTTPDFVRYQNDMMFEYSIAPAGQTPSSSSWKAVPISGGVYFYDLGSPNKVSDFYGGNSIAVHLRLKDCPNISRTFTTNIKKPNYFPTHSISCSNKLRISTWADYDGMLCYPLTLEVNTLQGNNQIYYKTNWYRGTNANDSILLEYPSGTLYEGAFTVTFTDVNGTAVTSTYNPVFLSSKYHLPLCNNYHYVFSISYSNGKPLSCYAYAAKITIKDINDNPVAPTETVAAPTGTTSAVYYISTAVLNYGVQYKVVVDFPDGTQSIHPLASLSIPASPMLVSLYNTYNCSADSGQFRIYSGDVQSSYFFQPGSTISVTAPSIPEFIPQTLNISSTGVTSTTYTNDAKYPPGQYTFSYNDGQCIRSLTYNHQGIYNYVNFGYDSLQTCQGLKITPTGYITYQGSQVNGGTFFRLLSGPPGSGYNTSVISPGGSYTLTASGTYTLGIMATNGISGCAMAKIDIHYTAPQLNLDPDITSAYVCVGDVKGNITIGAINGVKPYTYSLWDAANNVNQNQSPVINPVSGAAYFNYGVAGETYTVRVNDACNSSFEQKVTLSDLKTVHIVYSSTGDTICAGGTLELRCITLGDTQYSWTGPNSYTSPNQNPILVNFNSNMVGWYKVSVKPEYCGVPVQDSIYIRMYSPLTILNSATEYVMCTGSSTIPEIIGGTVSGGSRSYTYQWQWNYNGGVDFYDVSGAVSVNYTPTSQMIADGKCYFRLKVDDKCGTVYSNIKHVIAKPCGIPVNPILMNKAKL